MEIDLNNVVEQLLDQNRNLTLQNAFLNAALKQVQETGVDQPPSYTPASTGAANARKKRSTKDEADLLKDTSSFSTAAEQ